jgi:EAL domain-containing protein (putative c-di-GMP-specific phosphodiesterase class I)
MAHSLKLRVVAEGVETRRKVLLQAEGCDMAQGFLLRDHCQRASFASG